MFPTVVKPESCQLDWVKIINKRNVVCRGDATIQNTPNCDRVCGVIEFATMDIGRALNGKQIGLSILRYKLNLSITKSETLTCNRTYRHHRLDHLRPSKAPKTPPGLRSESHYTPEYSLSNFAEVVQPILQPSAVLQRSSRHCTRRALCTAKYFCCCHHPGLWLIEAWRTGCWFFGRKLDFRNLESGDISL